MPIELRPYQLEALDCIATDLATPDINRVLLALPTASGKTVIFSEKIRRLLVGEPSARVLILVHRDELVFQTLAKLRDALPADVTTGVIKAESNDLAAQVIVAAVQTISKDKRLEELRQARLVYGPFKLLVIDEAHHGVAPTWLAVVKGLNVFGDDPSVPQPDLLGATATPFRFDQIGLKNLFQKISYTAPIVDLIASDYLCDVRAKQITLDDADFSGLKLSGNDFQVGQAGEILMQANAPQHVVAAYLEHAPGRKAIVFTPTVQVANEVARAFNVAGITAESVCGETPLDERHAILERFRTGETMVLPNCAVLTEGYDNPSVDCVIVARPTRSKQLYVQMIGRGLRPLHGVKQDCIILDMVGASNRHDLMTAATLDGLEITDGESVKEKVIRQRVEADARRQKMQEQEARKLVAREVELFHRKQAEEYEQWAVSPRQDLFILAMSNFERLVIWKDSKGRGYYLLHVIPGEPMAFGSSKRWQDYTKLAENVALDEAQRLAEEYRDEYDPKSEYLTRPDARWRSYPATPKQIDQARRARLAIPENATRGQMQKLLSLSMERFLRDKKSYRRSVSSKTSAA
jgi:superfamily II DNA or RNA helicase